MAYTKALILIRNNFVERMFEGLAFVGLTECY